MREKYTFAVLRLQDLGQFVAAVYGGDLHPCLPSLSNTSALADVGAD